jgi:hypothetical protein
VCIRVIPRSQRVVVSLGAHSDKTV